MFLTDKLVVHLLVDEDTRARNAALAVVEEQACLSRLHSLDSTVSDDGQ